MVSWCKKGEYKAQISQKSEPSGFKWAKTHNKRVHDYVIGKCDDKPLSFMAALHFVRN